MGHTNVHKGFASAHEFSALKNELKWMKFASADLLGHTRSKVALKQIKICEYCSGNTRNESAGRGVLCSLNGRC
jgi:hypothetical protein